MMISIGSARKACLLLLFVLLIEHDIVPCLHGWVVVALHLVFQLFGTATQAEDQRQSVSTAIFTHEHLRSNTVRRANSAMCAWAL